MIDSILPIVTAVLSGGFAGGVVGLVGNYYIQTKMQKFRDIDEIMKKFYNHLELSAIYWMADGKDIAKRRTLESQMIASQMIIRADYKLLMNRHTQINKSSTSTTEAITELWDATTEGCFQQTKWNPDHARVRQAASAIMQIVKSFH